jgi:hypothetical protein
MATKMRGLYAYNGRDLLKCNREVHLWYEYDSDNTLPAQTFDTSSFGFEADEESSEAVQPPAFTAPPRQTTVVEYSCPNGLGGLVLHGSGYGHGMGMSQWGARELADQGFTYDQILRYFYSNTEIARWGGEQPVLPPAGSTESDVIEIEPFYEPFVSVGA